MKTFYLNLFKLPLLHLFTPAHSCTVVRTAGQKLNFMTFGGKGEHM